MVDQRASIEHQKRDIAILRDLFVSRIMTLAHAAALHFNGSGEAAKKRIQKLKAAGLIAERARKARDPSVLYLARAGFDLLTERGELSDLPRLSAQSFERRAQVSELTLRHELQIMDVKATLQFAIDETTGYSVLEFTTWPMLCEFEAQPKGLPKVRVKPDGRLRVEDRKEAGAVYEHTFFLEVDRGTETLDTLTRRCLGYREHYASGGFAVSCGATRDKYAEYPFRVLVVLPSEARRDNLAERLLFLNPPILTQVWLTTMAEIIGDPLGFIWMRPLDYRNDGSRSLAAHHKLLADE